MSEYAVILPEQVLECVGDFRQLLPTLSIRDCLANEPRHDSGTTVGGREPPSSLRPIAEIIVDDLPFDVAGTRRRSV